MTPPKIETPRGKIYIDGENKAQLVFSANFQPKYQKRFSNAQKFVDSEVLRLCDPLIPFRTGMLIKSGILGTEIGSGEVKWIAPYARAQYYMKRKSGIPTVIGKDKNGKEIIRNVGTPFEPLRGPYWFERMKKVWGKKILDGAKEIVGGKK